MATIKPLSDEAKEARAKARADTAAVRRYLEGLEADKRIRGLHGRGMSGLSGLEQRLAGILAKLDDENTPVLDRLKLSQAKLDIETLIASAPDPEHEKAFEEAAARWGAANDVKRSAFALMGVPDEVLDRAKVTS